MNTYSIPIVWQSYKKYSVQAENLQEAVTKALSEFLKEPDDTYCEDSFIIDETIYDDYVDEDFDIDKAIQDIP
jgi:hypothetical protein